MDHACKCLSRNRLGPTDPASAKRCVRFAAALPTALAAALAVAPLEAQQPTHHGDQPPSAEPWFGRSIMITAELGGAAFSDFQRAVARPAPAAAGEFGVGDFRRRVSARTTGTVGGALTWWVAGGAGFRASVSYSPTRFSVWNEDRAQRALDEVNGEPPSYAKLETWMGSASAVFRFPFIMGRVVPYGIAGVGVVSYRLADDEEVPPEARARFADGGWTGPAIHFGVGSAIPLERHNLMLTFELTNHLSRTPLDDEGLGEAFEISGVPLHLASDPGRGSDGIGTTNHLRLTVGLTLPIRVPTP